jgi:cell division cycle protein 20 (cofactor of APC complex)
VQARDTPVNTITAHQSAVKAVSWCPWQANVLATAGGTVDRTVRVWNTASMSQLHSFDTGSQVSSIAWNTEYKEMVTGHGFSHNQLTVWRYPSMAKVADLTGHTSRVLLMATSPDGSTVASVAADETIRLWKIWPVNREKKAPKTSKNHPVSMLAQSIR